MTQRGAAHRARADRAADGALAGASAAYARAAAIADEHRLREEVAPASTELLERLTASPTAPPETTPLLARARRIVGRLPAHEGAPLRAEALLLAQRGAGRDGRRVLGRALAALHERSREAMAALAWPLFAATARA